MAITHAKHTIEAYTQAKALCEQDVKDQFKPARLPAGLTEDEQHKHALRVARADLRKAILGPLVDRRAEAAREYIHRAQALLTTYYALLSHDHLLASLTGQAPMFLGVLSAKLALPAPPVELRPPGWRATEGWGAEWIPGACAGDVSAQAAAAAKAAFALEQELRSDPSLEGVWPFGPA